MGLRIVTTEDTGDFRVMRAATGDPSAARWLRGFLEPEGVEPDEFLAGLKGLADGVSVLTVPSRQDLDGLLRPDDVLLVERMPVDAALLHAAGVPRRVVTFGSDVRHVDLDALRSAGVDHVVVERTTTANVADHTLFLVLALVRRFAASQVLPTDVPAAPSDRSTEVGGHPPTVFNWKGVAGIRALRTLRVGIVGAGEIGQAVATRLLAFGTDVAYWSRGDVPKLADLGVRRLPLEELAAWCDVLSIHLPYDASLHHVIDRGILDRVGGAGFVVNTSRGLLLDTDALLDALDSGALAGAALDVFDEEPLPPGHRLLGRADVVLTAHVGAGSRWAVLTDAAATLRAAHGMEERR